MLWPCACLYIWQQTLGSTLFYASVVEGSHLNHFSPQRWRTSGPSWCRRWSGPTGSTPYPDGPTGSWSWRDPCWSRPTWASCPSSTTRPSWATPWPAARSASKTCVCARVCVHSFQPLKSDNEQKLVFIFLEVSILQLQTRARVCVCVTVFTWGKLLVLHNNIVLQITYSFICPSIRKCNHDSQAGWSSSSGVFVSARHTHTELQLQSEGTTRGCVHRLHVGLRLWVSCILRLQG